MVKGRLENRITRAEHTISPGYDEELDYKNPETIEKLIQATMKKMSGEDNGEAWKALKPIRNMPACGLFELYINARDRLKRDAAFRGEKFISKYERDGLLNTEKAEV